MANPEPVVFTLLKLPPERQLFFRLREIAEVFLRKLDHLNLVLVASQEADPYPQAIQLLDDLREAAMRQSDSLFRVVFSARDFKDQWFRLLDSLTTAPLTDRAVELLYSTAVGANIAAQGVDKSQEEIAQFGKDIASAAQQIATAHTADGNPKQNIILNPENTQVVTDLLATVNEGDGLLRQIAKYYRDLEQHLQDAASTESNPPTEEEIDLVQERWIGFAKDLGSLSSEFSQIGSWLGTKPQVERTDGSNPQSPPTATATPADQPPPANTSPAGTKTITNASSPPTQTKRSFLRSLPRRLFSCLRIKYFD
ncbi:hypothetical protein P691DRAFT_778159 [Macrolepiota fuliginosa MF-IS2]|uniref:Uncharacterized protein n=1 Tax=Macrolepiota fuliginosa MF-IS2 TaxID=1400762 RepID=A0A9P5X4U4_9AGAR|nr:hypothetical protein P691DRAFT_778159 [Macrolepiota fuliginosa MF-IS2]